MIIALVRNFWRAQKRRMDRKILWEQCRKQAPNREVAKRAFLLHCQLDGYSYADMTEEELLAYIDALPWRDGHDDRLA